MLDANVTFHRCVQNAQDVRLPDSNKDHMNSIVFFTLEVAGRVFDEMSVIISQPFGTDYETEPIEVHPVQGLYRGPFNHAAFSEAVETYYRSLIGSQGRAIRIQGNATSVVMINNIIVKQGTATFSISESSGAW